MTEVMTVGDVHKGLLHRIRTQVYPPGSRLPSVRELAEELGSNPSTVDRAIHRLVELNVVRTVPRRGTYVTSSSSTREEAVDLITGDLREAVIRAWNAGVSAERIQQIVDDGIRTLSRRPRIAFVECNARDLERMVVLVENASGVTVTPLLLDDIEAGRMLDEEFDVIAAPMFHLTDLTPVVSSYDRVVEINFVASSAVLRRFATVGSQARVVVAAPTERGVQRMTAMVGQYHPGPIQSFHLGVDDPADLAGADLVVLNNAAPLPAGVADTVGEVISIQWELDPGFTARFRQRIEEAIALPR